MMSRTEQFIQQVALRKYLVIAVVLLCCLFAAYGMKGLSVTNDFRAYFSKDNPQLNAFEMLEQRFSKQDNLFFLIIPKDQSVFSKDVLSLVYELTEASWETPYSQRVSSLSNYQHTRVDGDDLYVDYLYESIDELTEERITAIRELALSEDVLLNNLIPEDGRVTGVRVSIALPEEKGTEASREAVAYARNLIKTFQAKYPQIEILLGGSIAFNVTLGDAVITDMSTLVLITYGLILILLVVLLRSWLGMAIIFIMISLSVASTLGIFGWLGYGLTPNAGFVPTAIMIIAIADSVHILINYYQGLQSGLNKQHAILESLRINAAPVFITSITTMIGVLSLNTSDSPPYRDMGNMIAVGVAIAFILSMTLVPALLSAFPVIKIQSSFGHFQHMSKFADWVIRHRKKLLIGVGSASILATTFVTNNKLTERWHEYFDETFEITRVMNVVNDQLSGIHRIEYMLDSGIENGIFDTTYLQQVEGFVNWAKQQDKVVHVDSFTTILKEINQRMHGDAQDWYRLPDSRELAAQYLLMYETSLPYGFGLDDIIDLRKAAIRISVVMKRSDSDDILALDDQAKTWLSQNALTILPTEGTGLDAIFSHISYRNINSIVIGSLLALLVISVVMVVALRSFSLGLISLVPNILPAGIAYGLWGLFGGYISMALSVVVCISLGIVVDDTVHFLTKYLRARREQNLSPMQATRYAFNTVGVAMVVTSIVLVAGFLVAISSHFNPTKELGILLSATIAIALIIDFLLLPPLLIFLDKLQFDTNGRRVKNSDAKNVSELTIDLNQSGQ